MVKVKLIGTPQTQWQINGHFFPGGQIIDLIDDEIIKYKKIIEGFKETVEIKKETKIIEEPKKPKKKGKIN